MRTGFSKRSSMHDGLIERARAVAPGGLFTSHRWPEGMDILLQRAEGSHVFDVDDSKYIDYLLGAGVNILGHTHPSLQRAIAEQSRRFLHSYGLTPEALELAERLVGATPGSQMVRFTNSGSEATFYALRIARAYTGREKVIKFEGGYHGYHDYAVWNSAPTRDTTLPRGTVESGGVPSAIGDTMLVCRFNEIETTRATIRRHASELAAIITEPYPRGVEPLPGFLQMLREEARLAGSVLIFDEIVTGFRFRYGPIAVSLGVTPDLTTYGKIVGGCLPLAAVCGPRELIAVTDPLRRDHDRYAYVSGTHYGNPLAAAAGLAMLSVLREPGTYEKLADMGATLRRGLAEACRRHGVTGQATGIGSAFNLLLTNNPVRDYRDLRAGSTAGRQEFCAQCLSRGVLLNYKAQSFVSLAHSEDDIATTVSVFDTAMAAIAKSSSAAAKAAT